MASLLQEAVERFITTTDKKGVKHLTKSLNSLFDVTIDPAVKEGLNTKRVFNPAKLEAFANKAGKDITNLTESQADDLVRDYYYRGLTDAQKAIETDIGRSLDSKELTDFTSRLKNELADTDFTGFKNLDANSNLSQYLGEIRASANPKYLDYYKVQQQVLGKEAAGIYDPARLESLATSGKWTSPEDSRAFWAGLKQPPKPINQSTFANTFMGQNLPEQKNILRANRGLNRVMYETGVFTKEEAVKRNKKVLKDIENENVIKKARIDAANGDPEALNIVNRADGVGETPWAGGMRAALGTAVGGAALLAAINSSRGQQNNAQLYGQQPLY